MFLWVNAMQLMVALHLSSFDVLLSLFGKCFWFFGWIWLVELHLEFGRITSSGWIDESSVAPACGEKPWPFAAWYKLANSFGSMMSLKFLRPHSSASVSLSVWSSLAPLEISLTWTVWVSYFYFGNHPVYLVIFVYQEMWSRGLCYLPLFFVIWLQFQNWIRSSLVFFSIRGVAVSPGLLCFMFLLIWQCKCLCCAMPYKQPSLL